MKKSELKQMIKEEIRRVNEVSVDETSWVAVKLNGPLSSWAVLGFTSEKNAIKAVDKFEKISDIKVFNVDFYGSASEDEIRKEYKPVIYFKNKLKTIDNTFVALIYTALVKFGK